MNYSKLPRTKPTLYDYLPRVLPWLMVVVTAAILIRFSQHPVEIFSSDEELHRFKVQHSIPNNQKILLLVTEWCPACKALAHTLNEQGVVFSTLDVEHSVTGSQLYALCLAKGAQASVPKVIYEREVISQSELFKRVASGASR